MNTLVLILRALGLQLLWWLRGLVRWRDPAAPMGARRALFLLLLMPLLILVQLLHGICLLLDELLFPRFRRCALEQTLVITGVPRSGTTFLHRTLAEDRERFVTMTTWEAVLAPSILQRRVIAGFGWLDTRLGGWGRRALDGLTRRLAGGLEDIHAVSLSDAEEDYLALLPYAGCFVLLLAFPGEAALRDLARFDQHRGARWQQRLLQGYLGLLRRQRYSDPQRRRILSKNAAFGGWVASLADALPDARFILCAREPLMALSSQISSVSGAAPLFGTNTASEAFQARFRDIYAETFAHLADLANDNRYQQRLAVLDMDDLRSDPSALVRRCLSHLKLEVGERLSSHLDGLPRRSSSRHQHRPEGLALSAASLEQRLQPGYNALINSPVRIKP